MEAVIKEWGNSLAIRLPKSLLKEMGVGKDTKVELRVENNRLLIEAKREPTLDDMLSHIEKRNLHEEVDFGKPEGQEIW